MKKKNKVLSGRDAKLQCFYDIMHKYIGKLTPDELYEILNAGRFIYLPDNGLTFEMVKEMLDTHIGS